MDTDSAYMALSAPLEDLVYPHLRQKFFEEYGEWFPKPYCSLHQNDFIADKLKSNEWKLESCCEKQFKYDRRTPGLFKEEFCGEGIVALNSKTYCCWGQKDSKLSSKGISKKTNTLTKDQFLGVLTSQQPVQGSNCGFIFKDQKMLTYTQLKTGLTYFYAKRKVCKDGISTSPIDL